MASALLGSHSQLGIHLKFLVSWWFWGYLVLARYLLGSASAFWTLGTVPKFRCLINGPSRVYFLLMRLGIFT